MDSIIQQIEETITNSFKNYYDNPEMEKFYARLKGIAPNSSIELHAIFKKHFENPLVQNRRKV